MPLKLQYVSDLHLEFPANKKFKFIKLNLHNITKQEVVDFSPSIADKLARNTANFTVEEIANEIAELIKN